MKYQPFALAITALFLSSSINATTLTEDFSDAFPDWESNWFGLNSNAQNYYGAGSSAGAGYLWITDGDSEIRVGESVDIVFDTVFASTLTSLSLDVNTFVNTSIEFYDGAGSMILQFDFDTTALYQTVFASSSNGLSGFSLFSSGQIEGNTAIDNIVATVVPVPAAIWLFASGLLGMVGLARRKTRRFS